ncbi:probable glutamyl-tRNA(gln) amidotransferase subunit B mitochondrial [Clonorchis sinensis]|uniref:Glutamyl-tRNA(Gln) amidotransferase subunit B, mitochondrial n=1 Tax=Clonorchis sinensis TaxID=79923 RepID=H2KS80_CLOSI|nr:probable glutamyl-tRNA(gln) amidotransferase subunit B mitochondrial [Clonorchis sinensis]
MDSSLSIMYFQNLAIFAFYFSGQMRHILARWSTLLHVARSVLVSRYHSDALQSKGRAHPTEQSLVPLIGLEIHAQLISQTKLFSRTPYSFGAPPNTQLDLLDAAIPGSLPRLNRGCVEKAILIALALRCHINLTSQFDRKHYFYSDSPAGYQITQYWQPVAQDGYLDYLWYLPDLTDEADKCIATRVLRNDSGDPYLLSRARIRRIQLEQDTGKSLHDVSRGRSLIDLNRSGVGLVEIVTEPDFTHSAQASAFLNELATVLSFLGACNANASLGELRVDVNVSVGPTLSCQHPRTEVKNVNSIRAVARAIEFEIDRQVNLIRSGEEVANETRSFDATTESTLPMRDKEVIQDYRYLPEPNLPLLRLRSKCDRCSSEVHVALHNSSDATLCLGCQVQQFRSILQSTKHSELPNASRRRLLLDYSLSPDRATVLVENPVYLELYESCLSILLSSEASDRMPSVATTKIYHELAYWICGTLHGMAKRGEVVHLPKPKLLSEFVELTITGELFGKSADRLLSTLVTAEQPADLSCRQLALSFGLILVCDPDQMRSSCELLLRDNPKLVNLYRSGGKERKALKRLINTLFSDPRYGADKFNPAVAESVMRDLLSTM